MNTHMIFTAGLFLIGISLGLLFGYIGETMTTVGEVSYAIAILFFGGLSLIVSIFVKIKREEKNRLNG